jgi:RNA ligase
MKVPTYEEIKPYIEKKLVSEQSHPEDPNVRIFNYTQHCQFEQAWNDVTRQCRGLILNVATGEVLARPFPKFFNYSEHIDKGWPIPEEKPIITEKLDGSLGILYWLNGRAWIATRGSFTSDQAMWATNWWRQNVSKIVKIETGLTHLFEIIYPENRIVVPYDFSGLVFLETIDNETGKPPTKVEKREGFRTAKRIRTTDLKTLAEMDEPNGEGFVAYFPRANIRIKIKFPEYVRLHKLITRVSEIAIWEHMRDGKPLNDLIEKVPDEFFKWVGEVSGRIGREFNAIAETVVLDYERICLDRPIDGPTRKELALEIQKTKYPGLVFSLLDDKDFKPAIWRMVRPKGASAFKTDIDL